MGKVTTSSDTESLVAARFEIKALQNHLRSRDAQITQLTQLKSQVSSLKSALQSAAHSHRHVLGSCAKFHSYPDILVFWAVFFQTRTNLSFRQVQEVLGRIIDLLDIGLKVPQHTTIRNWVRKVGCHRLSESITTCEGHQIAILDESAGIGKEKMLLTLGIGEDAWETSPHTLTFEDVRVLSVKSANSWPSAQIGAELKRIEQSLSSTISYAVSDRGSNIRGGIKNAGLVQINDCTHWMSSCIERYYKTDTGAPRVCPPLFKMQTSGNQSITNLDNNYLVKILL